MIQYDYDALQVPWHVRPEGYRSQDVLAAVPQHKLHVLCQGH